MHHHRQQNIVKFDIIIIYIFVKIYHQNIKIRYPYNTPNYKKTVNDPEMSGSFLLCPTFLFFMLLAIINNYKHLLMCSKQIAQNLIVDYDRLIGKGSTGNVYQGIYLYSDHIKLDVAIKIIPLSDITNEVVGYLLKCELEALKLTSKCFAKNDDRPTDQYSLRNYKSSIVQLYDIIVVEQNCHIVMELLRGGTLKQFINNKNKLPEQEAIDILKQLMEGYKHLKDNGIVHRDLKPQNIIFNRAFEEEVEKIPKIIDFGYCQIQNIPKPNMFYNVGSPRYMSPQAYLDSVYSEKSDIWALGIIFYEMITGTNFDKGKQINQCFKQIKQKGIPIPSSLSTKTKKLLQMMLMFDPKKRQNCQGMLNILNQSQQVFQNNSMIAIKIPDNEQRAGRFQKNSFIRHSVGPLPFSQKLLTPPKNQPKNNSTIPQKSPVQVDSNRLFYSGVYPKQQQNKQIQLNKDAFHANFSNQKYRNSFPNNSQQIPFGNRPTPFNQIIVNENRQREIPQNQRQLLINRSEKSLKKNQQMQNIIRINNRVVNLPENMLGSKHINQGPKYQIRAQKSPNNMNRDRITTIPNNQNKSPKIINQPITFNSVPYMIQGVEKKQQMISSIAPNNSKSSREVPNIGLAHSIQFHQNLTPTAPQFPRPQIHFNHKNPSVKN